MSFSRHGHTRPETLFKNFLPQRCPFQGMFFRPYKTQILNFLKIWLTVFGWEIFLLCEENFQKNAYVIIYLDRQSLKLSTREITDRYHCNYSINRLKYVKHCSCLSTDIFLNNRNNVKIFVNLICIWPKYY